MGRVDNLIAGLIGLGLLAAFTLGLAESIWTVPFGVIVGFVLCLAGYDFYTTCVRKDDSGNGES